jgi:dihydropteroate synthase
MGTRMQLDFRHPLLMGVINVTPDSFSDGGRFLESGPALEHARRLIDAGADILDIGGESTRPGADPVPVEEELRRTRPVIEAIRAFSDIPISIDTSKPEVMRAAADAGADLINDVWALRRPGALEAAAETGLPVCLMHMQGEPGSMQRDPQYRNVVAEVGDFLLRRAQAAQQAGIPRDRILLDPGFGFGKTLEQNLQLFGALPRLRSLGYPLLVGISRKSMIGLITGRPVAQRLAGSLTFAALAVERGADVIRVHDVAETRDMLAIVRAVREIPQ